MKLSRRNLIRSGCTVAATILIPPIMGRAKAGINNPGSGGGSAGGTGFHNLKIGAGGFVTTLDISPDGTSRLAGTDTTGAYLQNAGGSWNQLIRAPGFPDASDSLQMNGTYHVLSAPSDPTRIYVAYLPSLSAGSATGYIYKSTDRGSTFARTTYVLSASNNCNDINQKLFGPKMAVDPANRDVVYFAEADGTFKVTIDSGTTWGSVPDVATAAAHPGAVVFDPASAVLSGKTQGIYIYSPTNGVYHSTDGGTSFALVAGGPATTPTIFTASHMKISADGVLYVTQKSNNGANSRLWRWQSSAWTNLAPNIAAGAGIPETIFIDPSGSNPGFLGCAVDGGFIYTHASYGGSAFTAGGSVTRTPTNITWFGVAAESYMTIGDMVMDPVIAGKVWFAEGIGVWSSLAANYNAWTEVSSGIENMIYDWVIAPSGGYPIVCCSDRPFFTITNPDAYATDYGPNKDFAIGYGASADWATSDPNFIVGVDVWNDESNSYSINKGVTWTRFPTNVGGFAVGRINGAIAASTDQNIVYVQSNRGDMYQTQNRGASWTMVPAANFKTSGGASTGMINAGGGLDTGWPDSAFKRAQIICADRVTTGVFYAHNWRFDANGGGIYKSIDGGVNWVRQSTKFNQGNGLFTTNNARLRSVPNLSSAGTGGQLFFTAGDNDSDALYYSTDGGVIWNKVGTGTNATGSNRAVGCGAIKPGNDYPSVYFVGLVNGVYGIWRSDNSKAQWAIVAGGVCTAITWTSIGTFPLGSIGQVTAIEGDPDVWGRCYVSTSNDGIYYYRP